MKIYELLAKPESWTQVCYYRDAEGKGCDASSAVAYCLLGAMDHCYPGKEDYYDVYMTLKDGFFGSADITAWNDAPSRTHFDVLKLCKEFDV